MDYWPLAKFSLPNLLRVFVEGGGQCTDTRARWGCGAHMFLLGGAGLGAHTCASRMCVAVPAGASQQHWGRGSEWYHGEEQGLCLE